jgi:DNA-binding LytR/AlgR family response regulator
MRILAVDDEAPALNELVYLLSRAEGVSEVVAAGSAAAALEQLQASAFDAVFLDIRMPGLDGLALAKILQRFAAPPAIVFVTAFDSHAVDAFELDAVDYLLKPIRAQRIEQALGRVRRGRAQPGSATPDETIAVELGGVTRYVKRSEVVYVEAQRDYVRLHTRTAGHLVRIPLAALEERWAGTGFLRVHRRFLVNSSFVEQLRSAAGHLTVDLGEQQVVPVSRRFAAAVKDALAGGPSR